MKEKASQLLWLLLGLAGLIGILHVSAIETYVYWTHRWFDILLHFLGGLWVALALLWGIYRTGFLDSATQKKHIVLFVIVGTLIVGGLWELFEGLTGVFATETAILGDTILDLVMDVVGAGVALLGFLED